MTRDWSDARAPDLEAFGALAREAFNALPAEFRALCGDVMLHVANFAEDDILDAMQIDDAFELTGLYEGVDVTQRSIEQIPSGPNHVHLYRLPLLAEWAENGEITLRELVRHVIIHEIGHHFGLSDEAMHRIEDDA